MPRARLASGRPLGPLHGVPVSVKDLIDVEGLKATYGSLTLKDAIAAADAPSVERLRAAGAIIIGKTTTSEFGYRGYTRSLVHGNTRNPWNLARTPGGSSGGAVASVAAGVSALALGTDGGGSIRAPSSLTGLVGIKANFARIPVWPASATPTLAHVGPIARNVDDAALLLSVCAGPDPRDPFSLMAPIGEPPSDAEVRGLRVAFSPTLGYARVDAPVAAAVAAAVAEAAGCICQHRAGGAASAPTKARSSAAEFIGGCSARLGDLVDTAPHLIDPPLHAAIVAFRATSADRLTRLLRRRLQHRETLRQFFRALRSAADADDAVHGLGHRARPAARPRRAQSCWSYFTYPFNLTGQPAGSLPCGLSADRLPIGLQIIAPVGCEMRLVSAMRAAETALGKPFSLPIDPR